MADALSRDRWVAAALELLARDGLEAVRVEPLARRLGVTKGSFYWHFPDRKALFTAMLASWERGATQAIIDRVEGLQGSPGARLGALFDIALEAHLMELELVLREWGRRDAAVARVMKRVDARRLRYLEQLFGELGLAPEEAGARAFLAYATLFGDHFIAADATPARRRAVLDRCATLLLDAPRRGRAAARGG